MSQYATENRFSKCKESIKKVREKGRKEGRNQLTRNTYLDKITFLRWKDLPGDNLHEIPIWLDKSYISEGVEITIGLGITSWFVVGPNFK